MKYLKKAFISLLVLLLVTIFTIWILIQSVKPEFVKNYIGTQLSILTNQKSKIDGDIAWQLFPRPAIKITKVQIGDENNQSNYSVKLDTLIFNLKITPLFRGQLVFNELNVDGFKVFVKPEITTHPNTRASKLEIKSNDDGAGKQFAIERFLLSHGQLIIINNQTITTLSGLQIGAENFNLAQRLFPLQFKTNVDITNTTEKILKTQINFKGNIHIPSNLFGNPLIALQNTPIEGQLLLQNTKINHLTINKINAHLKTKPGVLLLNPLSLNLYNGESVGDLSYEFGSNKLIINQTATNLDGSKLISDLINKAVIKGSLDFSLHTQMNLQAGNWQENTTGNGSLTIKDGVIEAVNLDKIIEETSNKIYGLLSHDVKDLKLKPQLLDTTQFDNQNAYKGNTIFKLLTIQYNLQNAKLQSNSLVLQTDKLQLRGEGSLNLKDKAIDSHLVAKVTLSNQEIDKIQQLLGGSFPIILTGTLTEPVALPDLQKINPVLTKVLLKTTLSKPIKEFQQTLNTFLY